MLADAGAKVIHTIDKSINRGSCFKQYLTHPAVETALTGIFSSLFISFSCEGREAAMIQFTKNLLKKVDTPNIYDEHGNFWELEG